MGISFDRLNRIENRRSPAIFDRKEIAHLGACKIVRFWGRGAAGNRAIWCTQPRSKQDISTEQTEHVHGMDETQEEKL